MENIDGKNFHLFILMDLFSKKNNIKGIVCTLVIKKISICTLVLFRLIYLCYICQDYDNNNVDDDDNDNLNANDNYDDNNNANHNKYCLHLVVTIHLYWIS